MPPRDNPRGWSRWNWNPRRAGLRLKVGRVRPFGGRRSPPRALRLEPLGAPSARGGVEPYVLVVGGLFRAELAGMRPAVEAGWIPGPVPKGPVQALCEGVLQGFPGRVKWCSIPGWSAQASMTRRANSGPRRGAVRPIRASAKARSERRSQERAVIPEEEESPNPQAWGQGPRAHGTPQGRPASPRRRSGQRSPPSAGLPVDEGAPGADVGDLRAEGHSPQGANGHGKRSARLERELGQVVMERDRPMEEHEELGVDE